MSSAPVVLARLLTWLAPRPARACEVGAYRGPAGGFAVIVEGQDTATTGEHRYVFRDGRRGGTRDATLVCSDGALRVGTARWPKIALRITPTTFEAGGVTLVGLLIEPPAIPGPPLMSWATARSAQAP